MVGLVLVAGTVMIVVVWLVAAAVVVVRYGPVGVAVPVTMFCSFLVRGQGGGSDGM